MPEFERWFLLAYTGYLIVSIFALLWVVGGKQKVDNAQRLSITDELTCTMDQ